jgi:hypothetical protein
MAKLEKKIKINLILKNKKNQFKKTETMSKPPKHWLISKTLNS